MPAPLPPEAAAAPAPEAPAPEAAPQEGGGSSLPDLLGNLSQGLNILNEVIRDSGKDPEASQVMESILAQYEGLVDKLSGGGASDPGAGDQMAGANPNAAPMPQ